MGADAGAGGDSWGAEEAEAAAARVRELEEEREVLQAERERAEAKRRAAEARAVALSSQSADLVRDTSVPIVRHLCSYSVVSERRPGARAGVRLRGCAALQECGAVCRRCRND